MADYIRFDIGQGIRAASGCWYRNVQVLGTGGSAVTLLVICTEGANKGVTFALKVFRRLSKPERRERFLREVQFLQQCSHPAVMRVFDSGVYGLGPVATRQEFPFVVAEYLPTTLFDVIRAGQAPVVEKVSHSCQLLSALQYLAGLSPAVVHRDIKPRNIFVKGHSCVLGDFGLMKLLDAVPDDDKEVFKESIEVGMPFYYRTPDLVAYAKDDVPLTPKSDVFQLGLVLTEMFTGWNPARKADDLLSPVELDPVGNIPGGLGASIATLLRRMLDFNPASRPTAAELLDPWESVFGNAVARAQDLEGRVF